MLKDKWFRTGLVGSVIAAVCCFTPLLVWLLGLLGLSALVPLLDFVLLPALLICIGILVGAILRLRKKRQ